MDMDYENNTIRLCGMMAGDPVYSHSSRGQDFYGFPLQIQRLSGNSDTVNILLRRSQLAELSVQTRKKLLVEGQLRSFNNRRGEGARLVITVFARSLSFCDEEDSNFVHLRGTLCRPPNLRCTPMGRDICDLMLAVNRPYSRSDYIPCICWGPAARQAAQCQVGYQVELDGRLQSRTYIKLTEDGPVEKTAFEVSVTGIVLLTPSS